MDKRQALEVLVKVTGLYKGTRAEHQSIEEALQVMLKLISDSEKSKE